MNAPVRKLMTQQQFFAWDGHESGRYEFDGFQPVAMTGGSARHSIILRSLHRALDARLRGSCCQYLGPDAGVQTVGDAVRYPDALITCGKVNETADTIPGVVALFEVSSPSSFRTDTVVKVLEYAAVPTIRHYVIIDSTRPSAMVFERAKANERWTASKPTTDDIIRFPELQIEIAIREFYEDIAFEAYELASTTTK